MSTEIKNTLFRFVTMRAPGLSDENLKEKRFVFRNATNRASVFDLSVETKSSKVSNWQAMQVAATTFIPLSEEILKSKIKSDFMEFAIWVARNKHTFNTNELIEKINNLSTNLSSDTLKLLWDNLFYQVITQKDFYVKEAIMQLLIANHISNNIDTINKEYDRARLDNVGIFETELIKNIVNAKVVLPKELFDKKEPVVNTIQANLKAKSTDPVDSLPSEEMKKFWSNSESKRTIDKHLKLQKELQKLEKNYRKEYQQSYDEAVEEHQEIIDSIIKKHQQQLEDSKRDWCNNKKPEGQYDANDPCNQPPSIPQPKLPKFKFQFRSELDFDYLNEFLTKESFDTLLEILEIRRDDEQETKHGDGIQKTRSYSQLSVLETMEFTDIYSLIQDGLRNNSQKIIDNTASQNTSSVSIGGVIVPVVTSKGASPFSYQICSKVYKNSIFETTKKYVDFDMTLELPDNSWQITHVKTDVTQSNGTTTSTAFDMGRVLNSVTISSLFHDKKLLQTAFLNGLANLTITISFSNGAVKSFSIQNWKTISCLSGFLVTLVDGPDLPENPEPGNPGNENPENPGNGTTNPPVIQNNFIPSGFGVKQLGIADYKKVEQTVQGYIEGDVAHIENIMAREYKEKATRKLRRSENTTSISSESEREQLSDTTSTNRFEMQSEVAKILQEDKDFSATASFGANWGAQGSAQFTLGTNVGTATHSTKEESNRQAITQAKEVTERAMERIVTKVKEERVTKIIEEFEENNKHGFDNTKGDKHVVGVYRWVDKIYKNQVFNYGKRLMFEFMVPEPAKLHLLGMTENKSLGTTLVKPIDPRKFEDEKTATIPLNLKDYSLVNENTAKYWAGIFNADVKPMPDEKIYISHSFKDDKLGQEADGGIGRWTGVFNHNDFKISENYQATNVKGTVNVGEGKYGDAIMASSYIYICGNIVTEMVDLPLNKIKDKITVSAKFWDVRAISGSLVATCELTPEAKIQWQQETFKAIMDAYEKALQEYDQKLAEENAIGVKIKDENPGFYRQIENIILRKNCISYIIEQNEEAKRTYGKNMFKPLDSKVERNFSNHEINVSAELDDYAAFSKFIEQAFEWDIMSYNFYPYYWGTKKDWASLYQYDNNDPLFRSFMQAGMARVIVTVRPGFEEAVNYYMQTGQIWNGGEVPVIEDQLFMSIADELRQTLGQKEGKAWATRLPTALTILQAKSIGLNVTKALPFDKDVSDFEDPDSVPQSTELEMIEAQLGASQKARIVGKIKDNYNIESKIVLKNLDGTIRDLTYCDSNGNWELNDIPVGKYQLLLDANNDFPVAEFEVTEGSKEQTVELSADQTLEINMTLKKL